MRYQLLESTNPKGFLLTLEPMNTRAMYSSTTLGFIVNQLNRIEGVTAKLLGNKHVVVRVRFAFSLIPVRCEIVKTLETLEIQTVEEEFAHALAA